MVVGNVGRYDDGFDVQLRIGLCTTDSAIPPVVIKYISMILMPPGGA